MPRSLLLVFLLTLPGCVFEHGYRVYGSDLETREGARAFLWPADAQGRSFRYVIEHRAFGAEPVQQLTLMSGAPPDLRSEHALSGATVVLGPDASSELRSAADALLHALTKTNPALNTHLVISAVGWSDVTSTKQLAARVREARDEVAPESEWSIVFGDRVRASIPDLVIMPQAKTKDFLVADMDMPLLFAKRTAIDCCVETTAKILTRFTMPAEEDDPAVDAKPEPDRWMVIVIPGDASAAMRLRCSKLLAAVLDVSPSGWAVVLRSTRVASADALVSPEAMEKVLSDVAGEPLTGTALGK